MEKIEAKYFFINLYVNKGKDQIATVVLTINYKSKSYSIEPYCGTKDFQFRESSHKWQMWKAVIKSIDEAIDFANNELYIN